jgi:hypothetical protein
MMAAAMAGPGTAADLIRLQTGICQTTTDQMVLSPLRFIIWQI